MDEFDNSQKKAKDEFVLLLEEKTKEIDFLKSSVRLMEVEKIKLQRELTERTKELQSVYKLCSLLAPRYSTLNKTLQEFTNNIPSVWQFSKITGVKIIVGNNEFKTPKFKTSEWTQSENILVGGETIGRIEIYCPEQIHGEYYGPFFKKGQNLLCVIAEILGGIIGLKSLNSKLEEEEGLNRALVDTMPFAMRIINQSGIIIYSNEKLEKQLGANIEGKSCWCTYCSDKKQCSDCPLENGISIGKTIVFESEEIVENKVFEISTTGAVYDGEKVLIEIFRDITEQKKTVTSLNNINERLQGILNDLGDALVSVDKNGICTQVNLQISKMFGYEVNEIVGYPVAKLYADPADRDGLFEELAKKKEITDWVCQGIRKDNSTIWVSMNVRYLRNKENEIEGTIALIRDVSERKMAHMELEEKKIQFDSALEIAGLGYYIVTGATAQIDYIDKRARNIFGMAKNQKSNTIPFWLRNIHPEDVKYVKTIHNSVYEG
ncbi:MAG: PAS domain S-box protein [Draconibacterium sp.]